MAWAVVAHTVSGNTDGQNGPFRAPTGIGTVNCVGADLYLVALGYYSGDPASTVLTDVSGNTYTLLPTQSAAGDTNVKVAWFYKVAPAVSVIEAWTVTQNTSLPQYCGVNAVAISGCPASPTITRTQSGTTSSTPSAGSIGSAGNLVVTAVAHYPGVVSSVDNSFQLFDLGYTSNNCMGIGVAWQNLSGGVAGAVNPTFTLGSAPTASAVQALSFTASGGAAFLAQPGRIINQSINRASTY